MLLNIMNLTSLLNSPVGQFVQCLWRGQESRENIAAHCTALFAELKCAKQFWHLCGRREVVNIIVIYVAYLSHMEKIMGCVSCQVKFACMRCKKPSHNWAHIAQASNDNDETSSSLPAEELTIAEMVRHGKEAVKVLGENPRDDSRAYTNFHQTHFGQIAPVLLPCLVQKKMPPCSLHLILSVHRVFWKIIHAFTKLRKQEDLIISALRKMGCQYMAFQLESYLKTKGKFYDGSAMFRLTENDCCKLEENIDSFRNVFVGAPSMNENRRARTKVTLFLQLVQLWLPVAHELRDVLSTSEREWAHFKDMLTSSRSTSPSTFLPSAQKRWCISIF